MRNVIVKYLKTDPRTGYFLYRRRVPKALADRVKKTEFVKTLGKTMKAALAAYGSYDSDIERLISLGKHGVAGLSESEQRGRLTALLKAWDADPYSPGASNNEQT